MQNSLFTGSKFSSGETPFYSVPEGINFTIPFKLLPQLFEDDTLVLRNPCLPHSEIHWV